MRTLDITLQFPSISLSHLEVQGERKAEVLGIMTSEAAELLSGLKGLAAGSGYRAVDYSEHSCDV